MVPRRHRAPSALLRRLFGALLAVAVVIGGGASTAMAMAAHGADCLTTMPPMTTMTHSDHGPAEHHHGSDPASTAAGLCPFTLCLIPATLPSTEANAPAQHRLSPGTGAPDVLLAGLSPPPHLRPPRPMS